MPERRPRDGAPAESLRDLQTAFAAHIRDPDRHEKPAGIEDRRMKIYRELFFSNVSSMLSSNFPVLRTLYEDGDWQRLIRDFYSEHRCQTPLFPELPKEFLRYLQDARGAREDDPPFLLELAHYEWVELALQLDERELDDERADPNGNLMSGIPVLSPLAWPLSYRFPVHRIQPGFQPREAEEEATHLLVYRDRDDEVKFMQLNDVTRYLLELLQAGGARSGRELLLDVAAAIRHPEPERMLPAGEKLLTDLLGKDILLGTRETAHV
ncbi:MAG: DUF2063 domain-containing protein [Xanthomonadales bacterium]|nr:DUF2063 domain-containing protein [Xanthomonadales bacterium]